MGKGNGPARDAFDITAASEVMAILCLATSVKDLEARLGRIIVGTTPAGKPVRASDLGASAAMTALLLDALMPNLVQTREGGPPSCTAGPSPTSPTGATPSSRRASRSPTGLRHHRGGLRLRPRRGEVPRHQVPRRAASGRAAWCWWRRTARSRCTAGCPWPDGRSPTPAALERRPRAPRQAPELGARPSACPSSSRTQRASRPTPTRSSRACSARFDRSAACAPWRAARASRAAARVRSISRDAVADVVDATDASPPTPRFTYELDDPPEEKVEQGRPGVYGADGRGASPPRRRRTSSASAARGASLPVCMAKTQLSLSDDPTRPGRPRASR
jgi:formate--tetrahydrofolate ligase